MSITENTQSVSLSSFSAYIDTNTDPQLTGSSKQSMEHVLPFIEGYPHLTLSTEDFLTESSSLDDMVDVEKIKEDDDDDFIQINESKSTPAVLSQSISPFKVQGQPRPRLKTEPQSATPMPPPRYLNPIARQRALLAKHKEKLAQGSRTKPVLDSEMTDDVHVVQPRFRGRMADMQVVTRDIVNVGQDVELAMRRQESNDWMDQMIYDSEDEELKKLEAQQKLLLERRHSSEDGLSRDDRLILDRVTKKIVDAKKRNRLAVRSEPDEEPMFVSETEQDQADEADRHRVYSVSNSARLPDAREVDDVQRKAEPGSTKSRKSKNPRGGFGKAVVVAREQEAEKARAKAQKKKDKPKPGHKAQGRAVATGKNGAKKKGGKNGKGAAKSYKSRMTNTPGVHGDHLPGLLQNLLSNNPIKDRTEQGDYGEAPVINETTKHGQFRALMASIPEEYAVNKTRNADKKTLMNAARRFGRDRVTALDGKWKLKGMKSPLYHHQLLAADWMITRELSDLKPHGGLLADAMGLGKTLETLAAMVGHPPDQDEIRRGLKSTLIVVPSSAIKQWQEEIENHVEEATFPQVLHYKRTKELPVSTLSCTDIVICSYKEVMMSYAVPTAQECHKYAGRPHVLEIEVAKRHGTLHKMDWYRIVLDEAQAIKNNASHTSLACQNLRGNLRWALSGTPIQNCLDELFPYFRFLRAEWTEDFSQFRKHFCDPDADDSNARIAVVLSVVMMRRTMKNRMFGRPIIELPRTHPVTMVITFSSAERALYRILEQCFRDNLNRHFAAGTAERNYGMFMVQLLRLRQCTAHPFLLERTIKDIFSEQDVRTLKDAVSKQSKHALPMYEHIKQWVGQSEAERNEAIAAGREPGEKTSFGRNAAFGKSFHMNHYLETLNNEQLRERIICGSCQDVLKDPQETDCGCIFCKVCLEAIMSQQIVDDDNDDGGTYTVCPACNRIFQGVHPYDGIVLRDDDECSEDPKNNGLRNKAKSKKDSCPKPQIRCDAQDWFKIAQKNPEKLLPSAKLLAVKAQVLKWLDAAPDDKVLIFTQFRMMARLVGMVCNHENWEHVYFTGDMNIEQRHNAVKQFHQEKAIRIMIASLKCGGQALNLTCANRVISIDLWWNHSVEQQAFARVFRIGQHKETYVMRVAVKNTVDMRMLDLQADKAIIIDEAMQDAGELVPSLCVRDLASLFGHLREDENGKLRVEEDYGTEAEE